MNILETIKLAINSLTTNKLRSFLTMLGIIIGIGAVITITTVGSTLTNFVSSELKDVGTNVVEVYEFETYSEDDEDDMGEVEYKYTDDDINTFLENNPGFHIMEQGASEDDSLIDKNGNNFTANINAYNDGMYQYSKVKLLAGRNLNEVDLEDGKHAMMVTEDFAKKYYSNIEDIIGDNIEINVLDESISMVVVGVYENSTSLFNDGSGKYETIISFDIYKDIQENLFAEYGLSTGVSYMTFYYDETVDGNEATDIVKNYFSNFLSDTSNLEVMNINDELKTITNVVNVLTIAISFIAGIALIVGGVGVMNIMLVSVIERTREIGIEKALGAKNNDIRIQFLIESVVICLMGCIIGILVGIFNGFVISLVAGPLLSSAYGYSVTVVTTPSVGAILLSCIFSTLIGIFFGLYPANQAAKLNPIEALRYE